MASVEACIFDLDDTLYPERAFAFSGFAAVARAFAHVLGDPAQVTARMRQLFDTGHRGRIFNTMLAEKGLEEDEQLIARMIKTYHTHQPTIALYEDAEAALTRLRNRCKLGLITDGPPVMQKNKIDALGLRTRIDEIILTAELGEGYGKPDPRAFELMSQRLAVDAPRCGYVADNPAKDFLAPNALGWKTIQIKRPDGIYRDEQAATTGRARHIVETLDDLLTLFQ